VKLVYEKDEYAMLKIWMAIEAYSNGKEGKAQER
jgi:hypothetical protein